MLGSSTQVRRQRPSIRNFTYSKLEQLDTSGPVCNMNKECDTYNSRKGTVAEGLERHCYGAEHCGIRTPGFSDCTRCFSCGIGLRNWEDGDTPWIEHARWCPTCDFLRQRKGDLFIQMHRQDNSHEEQYLPEPPRSTGHFDDSMKDMKKALANTSREEEDISVSSVLEMGYSRLVVNSAVQNLRTQGKNNYSATDIMGVIFDMEERQAQPNLDTEVPASTPQTASHSRPTNNLDSRTSSVAADGQSLLKENQDLKAQMKCKICLDKAACMVYLPCGHMITCQDCVSTIRKCCICRKLIQGVVKAYM